MLLLLALACTAPDDTATGAAADTGADTATDTADTEDLHARVSEVDGLTVLELWGTRDEIGYAEGSLYCAELPLLFKDYVLDYLVADYNIDYGLVLSMFDGTFALPPGDEAELQAIMRGAQDHCTSEQLTVVSENLEDEANGAREVTYEDLLAANAIADFGCSSFTAWGSASASGETIHARNFDWAIDPGGRLLADHVLKVVHSTEERDARFASLTTPGLIGCLSCFTAEGVGITMHNTNPLDATQATGIVPRMMAARAGLTATWQASDVVQAAEDELESLPQRTGSNLHLSFPTSRGEGGGAVFELDGDLDAPDGAVTVRRPGDDPDLTTTDGIACTNHYLDRREPQTSGDSWERLATLDAGLDAATTTGGLDADGARDLIAQVERPETAHTVIMDTATMQLRVYVAPETGTPAPEATPSVIELTPLFDALP